MSEPASSAHKSQNSVCWVSRTLQTNRQEGQGREKKRGRRQAVLETSHLTNNRFPNFLCDVGYPNLKEVLFRTSCIEKTTP